VHVTYEVDIVRFKAVFETAKMIEAVVSVFGAISQLIEIPPIKSCP